MQAKRSFLRVKVPEEIVDVRDLGERGAYLLDATERGLCFGFAVLDAAINPAAERLDKFRSGDLEGLEIRRDHPRPHRHHERRAGTR